MSTPVPLLPLPDDPVKAALWGFLRGASLTSSLPTSPQVPLGAPVEFRVATPGTTHLPLLPDLPGVPGLPPGVPGGLVPTVLEVAPRVWVTWEIHDTGGAVDPGDSRGIYDYVTDPAADGLAPFTVAFRVRTHALDSLNPLKYETFTVQATLHAEVRLPWKAVVDDGTSLVKEEFTLPPLAVTVPSVGIPQLALLCNRPYFGAGLRGSMEVNDLAYLLFVPHDSPLSSADTIFEVLDKIAAALEPVNNLTSPVAGLVNTIQFFSNLNVGLPPVGNILKGLSLLSAATQVAKAAGHQPISFTRAYDHNGIPDLEKVGYGPDDVDDFDDAICSVLILGPGPVRESETWQPTCGLELFQAAGYSLQDIPKGNAASWLLYQIGTSLSVAIPDIRFASQYIPADYFPQGPYLQGRYRTKPTNNWDFLGVRLSPDDNDPLSDPSTDTNRGISSIRWWHPTYPPNKGES